MDQIIRLLANGEEIVDVDEESFLLFAQDIPSNNLGMLNPRAPSVEISINGNEYTIHQSPSLLSSHRAGGTTGAVLWKITPLFAEWITNPSNPLWTTSLLSQTSTVAELGTGISALVALVLAPSVRHYIATDQEYVRKLFRTNLDANASVTTSHSNRNSKGSGKSKGSKSKQTLTAKNVWILTMPMAKTQRKKERTIKASTFSFPVTASTTKHSWPRSCALALRSVDCGRRMWVVLKNLDRAASLRFALSRSSKGRRMCLRLGSERRCGSLGFGG
ncbi:Protein kinase, ATP binding site [Penicillium digitatum]|uniref:Protein kinase, ATP binding site n=1 Tax=Penicillium digitatum TaxID=36651 RepID=A0A7T7BLX9_PENDI|nr:Protein kinase, ATP binding site [Penicillium digitatum]